MADKRTIAGFILLGIAVLLALSYTSAAGLFSGLPGLEPDGKAIQCQLSMDVDSIHSQTCDVGGSCSTWLPFGLLDNLLESDSKLSLYVLGEKIKSQNVGLNVLGANTNVAVTACVPSAASSGLWILTNSDGQQKANLGASW